MKSIACLATCAGVVAGCCCPQKAEKGQVTVASSDGRNEIRLSLGAKDMTYEVLRDGIILVAKTPINMTVNGRDLFRAGAAETASVTFETRAGRETADVYKKDFLDLAANEAFVDFGAWGVRLVARDDGVAYRFETRFKSEIIVDGETASVTIPAQDAVTWANFGEDIGCEETVPRRVVAKDLKDDMIYLPFVYALGGKTVAVTESNVRAYPIWDLRPAKETTGEGVALTAVFAPRPTKTERRERHTCVLEVAHDLAKVAGARTFPWRTFILADAPSKLCEADIVAALAEPRDKKADFSWVKPGKVAWDWWNAWDNQGEAKGCTTKGYERFIDFAAKNGVEYVILDEGWSEHLNIWKFHPNVDVPHLIRYGEERGVGIILWMAWSFVEGDEARVAEHFAKLGAKGFKVDFMDRGDEAVAVFLETFAKACAKNKMLVDYHGIYRPTGMQREYPNIVNYEGIHGLEQMKWYDPSIDMMANDVRAAFLRMTAGPMDYTPGAMDNYVIGQYRGSGTNPGSVGTRCHQMAMMAAYEAPLQMLSDAPTKYERNMESFSFMAKVPTVWSKTVGLGGSPDNFFAVAREAKDGVWYASAIGNADAHDVTIDTSFLGAGAWTAEIFRDAPDSDKHPTAYVHETKRVQSGDRLAFHLAPGGGFIVRFEGK